MEKEGFVSLWIGNIDSQDSLDEYAELIYTDEGEWLPSTFLADFNIDKDDFDEDFIEKICHEKNVKSLNELIAGCSYEDVVIPGFINVFGDDLPKGVNSAILLYNYEYDGNTKKTINGEQSFRYISTVQYK
jgi:hypothetical protein